MAHKKCDEPGSLVKKTLKLLHQRGEPLDQISKDADVPFYWLRKFSAGNIPSPSVNRVQRLFEYLSATKLSV